MKHRNTIGKYFVILYIAVIGGIVLVDALADKKTDDAKRKDEAVTSVSKGSLKTGDEKAQTKNVKQGKSLFSKPK